MMCEDILREAGGTVILRMLQVFQSLAGAVWKRRGRCAVSEREQLVGKPGDLNRYGIGRGG